MPNLSENLLASVSRDFFRPLTRPSAAIHVNCAERLADVAGEAGRIPRAEAIALKCHRYRKYLIERLTLLQAAEPLLRDHFGETFSHEMQARSSEIVVDFSKRGYLRFPQEWAVLCESLQTSFTAACPLRPFHWRHPVTLLRLLETVKNLSECE